MTYVHSFRKAWVEANWWASAFNILGICHACFGVLAS